MVKLPTRYQVSIQFGRKVDQTYEDPSRVTIPISRPQTVYIMPIMTTPANKFILGWPPLIPLNYE
jgi:hypothetical protein